MVCASNPRHPKEPTMPITTPITPIPRRELAHRRSCGIDVRLLWDPADGRLTVEAHDEAEETILVVAVGERPPLAVFQHPYAYAA
jgi:hypothetical protein